MQPRRPLWIALSAAALVLGQATVGVAVGACDGEGTTTTGKHIVLHTEATLGGTADFTNAFLWNIHLEKAIVSVGPFYYFSGAPIVTADHRPAPPRWDLNPFAIKSAYAHPGHYDPGEALGEMLEPTSFDLLAGVTPMADGDGITSIYRSTQFHWTTPPKGPMAATLGANVVLVEGTAKKDALMKHFRLVGGMADVLDPEGLPQVDGCTFQEVDVESDGKVTAKIWPSVWLDQAEFDDVLDSTDGKPVDVPATDRASKAFVRGLKKGEAYTFEFTQ